MGTSRTSLVAVINYSGKFANGAVTAAMGQAFNGNSYWRKAKALFKTQVPGMDLYECVVGVCTPAQWDEAVFNAALDVTPAGRARAAYKLANAVKDINKTNKVEKAASSCFVAGTLVHTINGLKPIEDIKEGDLVASKNDQTGETEFKPVVQLFNYKDKTIINLVFENENDEEELIQATQEHPFMLASGQWKGTGLVIGCKPMQINYCE